MVTTSVGPLLGLSCNKVHVVKGKWKRVVSRTVPSVDWPLTPPFSRVAAAARASAPACPAAPWPTVAIPAFVVLSLPLPLPVSVSTSVSVSFPLSVSVLVFLTLTPLSSCTTCSLHPLLTLLFPFFLLFLFLLLPPFLALLCPLCSGSFPLDKLKQRE